MNKPREIVPPLEPGQIRFAQLAPAAPVANVTYLGNRVRHVGQTVISATVILRMAAPALCRRPCPLTTRWVPRSVLLVAELALADLTERHSRGHDRRRRILET